ncbi:MAG: YbaB/EbfC family nucleoid-associated protein [Brevinematia bacterium]
MPVQDFKDLNRLRKIAEETKKTMESLRATGISKKGYVKITLDGEKDLKSVEFSDEAMKIDKEELSKCVKEAYKAAAKEIDKFVKKQMKNSEISNFLLGR